MSKVIFDKKYWAVPLLALVYGFAIALGQAQQAADAGRIAELRRLRDELKASDSFRNADAVVVLSDRAVGEAVKQFLGLEIKLASGTVVRLTSIETRLVTGAALIKLGLQYKSVSLNLSGRMASGEIKEGLMRLPIRVTEVKLASGGISGLLVKTMFGEWLKPETWNDELPSLDLPLELGEAMEIPASQFSVAGSDGQMPMEISTPAYRAPLKLRLGSVLMMDRRVVLALRINSTAPANSPTDMSATADEDALTMENQIAQLGGSLTGEGDVRLRISRNVISSLLAQIAAQQNPDLNFKLKQGRVRAQEVKAIVSILNYTDVETGEGQADVSELTIESIADGKVNVRLNGQGVIDARVKGREFGVPYGLSPRTTFVIKDQLIPLQFVAENGKVILRAASGAILPISVRFSLNVAGRDVGVNRIEAVQVDRWLSRIELPAILNREVLLPRKMEIDAGGNFHTTEKQKLNYTLSNLRVVAGGDALDITADVTVPPRY